MRLGEIKLQALALMYPDLVIRYDDGEDGDIDGAVYELKSNPNLEGVLESSIGSINRAFAHVESMGLSTSRCVDIAASVLEKSADGRAIIAPEGNFYSVERVLCHRGGKTYACGYEMINGTVYADYMARGVYTLVYKTKIPRVRRTTADSYAVDLNRGVCEAIPYFVASELLASENSERAKEYMRVFQLALERIDRRLSPCGECFQIIYSAVDS